jgi:hypothetical protein
MPAGRPHGPNDPSLMSSLEAALRPVHRPGPLELAWNWRSELGLLGLLAAAAGFIVSAAGPLLLAVTAGAVLAAGAATLLCWRSARRRLAARAWCLITPHRIRAGCGSAWVQTRNGRLPFILSVTPADYGERVRIWLLAGLTAADLDAARGVLAAACWATEVRVVPSPRHAHLITLEVIRRTHPERVRPAPDGSPSPRRLPGDGQDGAAARDTWRWPGKTLPPPRLSPEAGWPERDEGSLAPVSYEWR